MAKPWVGGFEYAAGIDKEEGVEGGRATQEETRGRNLGTV